MNSMTRLQLIAFLVMLAHAALSKSDPIYDGSDEDPSLGANFDIDWSYLKDHPLLRKIGLQSMKRSPNRLVKKIKPIVLNGYSMDINIEHFKSDRRCDYDEVCKHRYKPVFECVCPKRTLCVGQGSMFEAKCSQNLAPYVWIQHLDDSSFISKKFFP